jgi:hypothetical protein
VSLEPEAMLVKCPATNCSSGLIDIGIFDDLEEMEVQPFTLTCREGHKHTYKASDMKRENDWDSKLREKPYVDRHVEFFKEQEIHKLHGNST